MSASAAKLLEVIRQNPGLDYAALSLEDLPHVDALIAAGLVWNEWGQFYTTIKVGGR